MGVETFRFKIGEFDCISINDCYHDYHVETFFANVPLEIVQEALRQRDAPTDRIPSTWAVLYIDTGSHKVLVDTGVGGLLPEISHLQTALAHENINPTDIDIIIITHAHPDHIGGLLDDQDRPVYRNAQIFTWKREWDFWLGEHAIEKLDSEWEEVIGLARNIHGQIESQLTYIEPDCVVVPGISLIDARGHTPGHMVVLAESGSDCLLYISDTVFHPLNLERGWLPNSQLMIEPDQFVESKQKVFDMAARRKALVHAMHFSPFPCLGTVEKAGDAWNWHAIQA